MSTQSDNDYTPNFEIMDRYINFSSELLRISLLAIGGLCAGFALFHRFYASAKNMDQFKNNTTEITN